jgi:hypothetical protein
MLMIPKEESEQAGIDPNRHAYLDYPELGLVGYPTNSEAIHQMHCLNVLRMNLYFNVEYTRQHCGHEYCHEPGKYAELHIGKRAQGLVSGASTNTTTS